jgi:hypothetical protein
VGCDGRIRRKNKGLIKALPGRRRFFMGDGFLKYSALVTPSHCWSELARDGVGSFSIDVY